MSKKRGEFRLSSEASYALKKLLENLAENTKTIVLNSLRIHLGLLRAHGDKTLLFSAKEGEKPFPIHLLDPSSVVNLPPEAHGWRSVALSFRGSLAESFLHSPEFAELKQRTNAQNETILIQNALLLQYDLLQRTMNREIFFSRTRESAELQPVELFKSE